MDSKDSGLNRIIEKHSSKDTEKKERANLLVSEVFKMNAHELKEKIAELEDEFEKLIPNSSILSSEIYTNFDSKRKILNLYVYLDMIDQEFAAECVERECEKIDKELALGEKREDKKIDFSPSSATFFNIYRDRDPERFEVGIDTVVEMIKGKSAEEIAALTQSTYDKDGKFIKSKIHISALERLIERYAGENEDRKLVPLELWQAWEIIKNKYPDNTDELVEPSNLSEQENMLREMLLVQVKYAETVINDYGLETVVDVVVRGNQYTGLKHGHLEIDSDSFKELAFQYKEEVITNDDLSNEIRTVLQLINGDLELT
jgi:hypothetical protein